MCTNMATFLSNGRVSLGEGGGGKKYKQVGTAVTCGGSQIFPAWPALVERCTEPANRTGKTKVKKIRNKAHIYQCIRAQNRILSSCRLTWSSLMFPWGCVVLLSSTSSPRWQPWTISIGKFLTDGKQSSHCDTCIHVHHLTRHDERERERDNRQRKDNCAMNTHSLWTIIHLLKKCARSYISVNQNSFSLKKRCSCLGKFGYMRY